MNLFQLVFKQMRQRALSTWLTLLSVVIGVALAVAVLILQRESAQLFGQSDFGYDVIVGPPKVSPLALTLNTVYHMDRSYGNIPYALYEDLIRKGNAPPGHQDFRYYVRLAVPFMVGDSYHGRRLIGTSPRMFGFDDDGKPLEGYDDLGRLKAGYEPFVPEDERSPSKKYAAAVFEYRMGQKYQLARGKMFRARRFEAVIGSDVAEKEHLTIGSVFQATHGFPAPNEKADVHKPKWTVVGILEPTHTANDRVLFLPVVSLYAIEEHDIGMIEQKMIQTQFDWRKATRDQKLKWFKDNGFDLEKMENATKEKYGLVDPVKKTAPLPSADNGGELMRDATPPPAEKKEDKTEPDGEEPDAYTLDANGDIVPELPPSAWELSAVLVRTRGLYPHDLLMNLFRVSVNEGAAVNPASVMREFFESFLAPSTLVLLVISRLVIVVAGVSILVSIYNSVSARMREIAILRALGATRTRILTLICVEAALVGLIGSALGLLIGHLSGAVESFYFVKMIGQGIEWWRISQGELAAVLLAVVIAAVAGLVPGIKAYSSPVATNLTAS